MIKPKPALGFPAIECVEEAVTLLRRTPAATLLCSFIGGVPFWLALLYFVADMSRDAFAGERLAGASLSLAVLYLWKKSWQTVYASRLHQLVAGVEAPPWTFRRIVRLVLTQAQTQYLGLLLRPLAYNALFPTAWASAYYQNVMVLGDGRADEAAPVPARAWQQARLWPLQNHMLIAILTAFLFFVWVNIALICGLTPFLMKSFLGIETMASRDYSAFLFNTTFFTTITALALLLVDPIWTAAYVVRCFHGTSLQTGADLRASLRAIRSRATALALLVMMAFTGLAPAAMQAAPTPAARVDPERLDRSIEETLERREFAWRFRRIEEPSGEAGWIDSWLKAVQRWFKGVRTWVYKQIIAFARWLSRVFKFKRSGESHAGSSFHLPELRSILYITLALVIAILAWAGWRYWRAPRRKTVLAQAVTPLPDLEADDVHADELPEDGWMQLARDLADRGELRLALRAAYLGGLAHLGQQQFVSIARHKSNLDYQRELRRRARSRAELLAAFDENLVAFERAWYGDHGVTMPIFEQFTLNLERIRAC